MKSKSTNILNYLGSANLSSDNFNDKFDITLINKLRNIEQCIVEKDFLDGLDIVRQIIGEFSRNNSSKLRDGKTSNNEIEALNFGALKIEKKIGKVILNKQVVGLTTNEFSLLMMLVEKPNEIITRDKLHKSLLKTEYDGLNRSIDNTISRLRKKLGDENIAQLKIKSIRGKGYLFSSEQW